MIQIECREALECADDIAAVDGVDVLFVGPLDLSISLGRPLQFDDAEFKSALTRVAAAARGAGRAAGILIMDPDQLPETVAAGFTFVALGADIGILSTGMQKFASAFDAVRQG